MGDDAVFNLDGAGPANVFPAGARVELDETRYLAELGGFDISEEQKVELLQTLWSIMRSFVELGFSVEICAELFDGYAVQPAALPDDVVSAEDNI